MSPGGLLPQLRRIPADNIAFGATGYPSGSCGSIWRSFWLCNYSLLRVYILLIALISHRIILGYSGDILVALRYDVNGALAAP